MFLKPFSVKVFQYIYGGHCGNGLLNLLHADSATMDTRDAMLPRCHVSIEQMHALGN